jgi:hypothetical protein
MRSTLTGHLQKPNSPFCLVHQFFKNVGSWIIPVGLASLVCLALTLQDAIIIVDEGFDHFAGRYIRIAIIITDGLKVGDLWDASDGRATDSSDSFRKCIDRIENRRCKVVEK